MIANHAMKKQTRQILTFLQWGFTRKEAERRVKEGRPLTYWEMSEIAERNLQGVDMGQGARVQSHVQHNQTDETGA